MGGGLAVRGERYIWAAIGSIGGRRFRDHVDEQAADYWSQRRDTRWEMNSHWRDAVGDEAFEEIGAEHLAIYDMFARALDRPFTGGTVVDWGCGGGANAVAFAPRAETFIGVDISTESLAECERQVRAVCDTAVETRLVELTRPAAAADGLQSKVDLFLCLYVIETMSGPDAVRDLLRIASDVLASDGVAYLQVKYHTQDSRTRGLPALSYARNLGQTTTFAIEEFWSIAAECGLEPKLITLVPQTRFDVRYAYYALVKRG